MATAEARPPSAVLPETETVHWRPRVDERQLRRMDRLWTLTTVGHVVPFTVAAAGLLYVEPRLAPVAIVLLAHAWIIPELYAQRGANVLRLQPRAADGPERRSIGLLGDLVDLPSRELHARTGLVREEGRLGTWLVGEAGALLVRKGGRRVHCYCVRVNAPNLPSGDRIAHLLLALRADEQGFATVANLAFSGARWRVRRRLRKPMRPVLSRKMRFGSCSRPAG
jgi:hypothetical protein